MSKGDEKRTEPSFHTFRKRYRRKNDSGGGSDTSSCDEEVVDEERGHDLTPADPYSPPPSKRRHLASEDVGRFAGMSLLGSASHTLHTVEPSEVTVPHSPRLPERSPADEELSAFNPTQEVSPSAVEEPDDEVDMRARRGPNTIQLDKDRFYITSLSDSSSDEEDEVCAKDRRCVDEIISSRKTDKDETELRRAIEDGNDSQNVPEYEINGKLLSRLQILDWQRRCGVEASRRSLTALRATTNEKSSTNEDAERSSLILWRKPNNITTDFGDKSLPLVHEDGMYAFVQRPSSNDDRMDIDQ